ncbi:hypothetical protein [Psychromonas sp. MME2]|uniref:hypothetical protein n=1 Tax=unclassified Psychromonas TaxID=2614957 RepID=UPI00339C259B
MFKKIIIILLACVLIILLFGHIPDLIAPRLIWALWPIGHVVCFSLLAWLLISFNTKIKSSNSQRQLLILLLATLIVGCAIELIQPLFSRSRQLTDIYYNLFGALAIYLFLVILASLITEC